MRVLLDGHAVERMFEQVRGRGGRQDEVRLLRGRRRRQRHIRQNGGRNVRREAQVSFSGNSLFIRGQGGVKSTPSSPRLRVGVILTDPEPAKEALGFSYSDPFQLNQLPLWEWEAVRVKYQRSRGHSASMMMGLFNYDVSASYVLRITRPS